MSLLYDRGKIEKMSTKFFFIAIDARIQTKKMNDIEDFGDSQNCYTWWSEKWALEKSC